MKRVAAAFTEFVIAVTSNPISLVGTVITTTSALLFSGLFAVELAGFHGGPYLGIIAFLILPGLFLAGLALIPVGRWRDRQRARQAAAYGLDEAPPLPVWDLNDERFRRNFLVFVMATIVNLLILGVATYKGVEVMDSTPFCGATCHSVMQPEYTTYRRSPHARVACVECHIGPGANWFVKSKLSGSWQLVAVTLDLYPRPIPVPVHNLRPARETCEQCHWPEKFVGDRLRVRTHFAEDEANTELKTVLLVKVGGVRPDRSNGIHWHVDKEHEVRYRSDEKRETIYEVELLTKGQSVKRWAGPKAAEAPAGAVWRTMDCIDCHNRPTHIYRQPEEELDLAFTENRLDRSLPFLKREGLKAMKQEYASQEAAAQGIGAALQAFYAQNHPEIAKTKAQQIEAAAGEIGRLYSYNVFPQMNIKWGTYPNHIGHLSAPGCLRCHDEEHATASGETISGDCGTCHSLLADGEQDPEVLKTLNP